MNPADDIFDFAVTLARVQAYALTGDERYLKVPEQLPKPQETAANDGVRDEA